MCASYLKCDRKHFEMRKLIVNSELNYIDQFISDVQRRIVTITHFFVENSNRDKTTTIDVKFHCKTNFC